MLLEGEVRRVCVCEVIIWGEGRKEGRKGATATATAAVAVAVAVAASSRGKKKKKKHIPSSSISSSSSSGWFFLLSSNLEMARAKKPWSSCASLEATEAAPCKSLSPGYGWPPPAGYAPPCVTTRVEKVGANDLLDQGQWYVKARKGEERRREERGEEGEENGIAIRLPPPCCKPLLKDDQTSATCLL